MSDIIKKVDEDGDFVQLEDGFVYYWPSGNKGCISAHDLRLIANELDKRNAIQETRIDEYFTLKSNLSHLMDEFQHYASEVKEHLDEHFCPKQRSHCVRANDGGQTCCKNDPGECPVIKYIPSGT